MTAAAAAASRKNLRADFTGKPFQSAVVKRDARVMRPDQDYL
jgi:hypothetical protein